MNADKRERKGRLMKAIMYHYVGRYHADFPYHDFLDVDRFSLQVDYLVEKYGLLSREEYESCISNKKIKEGCILTFDDGLRDHYDYVLPILKEKGLFGLFFIPTLPFTEENILDVHRVHLLLGSNKAETVLKNLNNIVKPDMLREDRKEEFEKNTYKHQKDVSGKKEVKRLLNYYIDYSYRDEVLDQIMKTYFPDEQKLMRHVYMTEEQLKAMHEAGMIIGSHTISHPVLSRLTKEQQQREIADSFVALEKIIGDASSRTFCYPYGGKHTYDDTTIAILNDLGCICSYDVNPRDIEQDDLENNLQSLPRYDCNMFPHGQCNSY